MEFKTVSIVKYPPGEVWRALRDHLAGIGERVEEIESIRQKEITSLDDARIRTVSVWKAAPALPELIRAYLQPAMLSWTDTSVWDEATHCCEWVIESHYFRDKALISGHTLFEPALGGRGCRLTFEGNLLWQSRLTGLAAVEELAVRALEPAFRQLIPANFRKVTAAIEAFLAETPST